MYIPCWYVCINKDRWNEWKEVGSNLSFCFVLSGRKACAVVSMIWSHIITKAFNIMIKNEQVRSRNVKVGSRNVKVGTPDDVQTD